MTETLFIGDRAYSSWSLRGWLLFEAFGLKVRTEIVDFSQDASVGDQLKQPPARTVPTWISPEGAVVSESLALAEELAQRFPEAGLWPADPAARATARTLAAEMHSGFGTLRELCPMNLRAAYREVPVGKELRADLDRLEELWQHARGLYGGQGPWLCGTYSVADAFFAPVAARIAGYGLPVSATAQSYVDAHLADPAFRRWRAMGLARGVQLPWYDRDYPQVAWPGPAPIVAQAVDSGTPENATCPYSGKPVTHLMAVGPRVFGFCNAFCRDKTVPDPGAWPAFAALL